ncbi:hypothetical protein [Brevibacillus centrosporus]|uniref:hypothetical protein n=1 Tax=Brevibacillus centrosporus TaxID=54910 RepID=UPI003818A9B6
MGFGKFGGFSAFASSLNIENIKQTLPLAPGEVVKFGDVCEVVQGFTRKTKRAINLTGAVSDAIDRTMTMGVKAYKISETFTLLAYVTSTSAIEVLLIEYNSDGSIKTPLNTALSISVISSWQHDLFIDKMPNGKYAIFTNGLMSSFVVNVDLNTKAITMTASKTAETGTNYGQGNMWVQKVAETASIVKYAAFYRRGAGGGLLYTIFSIDLASNSINSTTPTVFGSTNKRSVAGYKLSKNRYILAATEDLVLRYNIVDFDPATDTFVNVFGISAIGTANTTGNNFGNYMRILNYAKNKFLILASNYNNNQGQYYTRAFFVTYDEATTTLSLDAGTTSEASLPLTGYTNTDTSYIEPMQLIQVNFNMFMVAGTIGTASAAQEGTRISVYRLHLKSDGTPDLECVASSDYVFTNAIAATPDFVPYGLDKYHFFFGHNVTGQKNIKMANVSARGCMPVGVATHDASSGSVTIQMKGVMKGLDVVCGQSYRANEYGVLSYIEGAYPIGTAISSDSILIPDLIKSSIIPQD